MDQPIAHLLVTRHVTVGIRESALLRQDRSRRDEGGVVEHPSFDGRRAPAANEAKSVFEINVPADVIEVLRWHERTQFVTEEQRRSELLFPAENGRFRSEHVRRKSFARVCALIALPLRFTPHGLRRTFNDWHAPPGWSRSSRRASLAISL